MHELEQCMLDGTARPGAWMPPAPGGSQTQALCSDLETLEAAELRRGYAGRVAWRAAE